MEGDCGKRSFEDVKDWLGFSILTLIPPIKGQGDKTDDPFLRNVELLLGETSKNLTKVDININFNTTVLPQTGTTVCDNIALLCCTFAHVQFIDTSNHDSHPILFLYSTLVQLGTKIYSQLVQDAVHGDTEQTILLSYTTISCLDTITMNIGKEASNPDMN